jgi:hypothetical protein
MEQIGFAKMIVQETPIHLQNLGMDYHPVPDYHNQHESYMPDEQTITNMWTTFATNNDHPLQHQQAIGIDWDDPGALNSNFDGLLVFEPDESTHMLHHPRQFPSFNQQWQ